MPDAGFQSAVSGPLTNLAAVLRIEPVSHRVHNRTRGVARTRRGEEAPVLPATPAGVTREVGSITNRKQGR